MPGQKTQATVAASGPPAGPETGGPIRSTARGAAARPWRSRSDVEPPMRSTPILNPAGEVIGMITDRDICIALGRRNIRASDVLGRDVSRPGYFTCGPDDDVRYVLKTMAIKAISRLPVIDESSQLARISIRLPLPAPRLRVAIVY